MNRKTLWFVIALCTFMLGLVLAAMRFVPPHSALNDSLHSRPQHSEAISFLNSSIDLFTPSKLPVTSHCELITHPDLYSGKVVRVRAKLSSNKHGTLFYDDKCARADDVIAVSFHPSIDDEVGNTLTQLAGTEYYGSQPLDVIVMGKFEKVAPTYKSDLNWHTVPLHFEIMLLQEAAQAR